MDRILPRYPHPRRLCLRNHCLPVSGSTAAPIIPKIDSALVLETTSVIASKSDLKTATIISYPVQTSASVDVVKTTVSGPEKDVVEAVVEMISMENTATPVKAAKAANPDSWCHLVKGSAKRLEKKGTPFTLPSGEVCVKIPNNVIEKNMKSWECFVLGQFSSDPPPQGLVHNIVNGI
ncbi:hypothetical protein V5N11_018527 [Cardamine amara subsp. amara]|uniref:Uncharacterized protein n=1 Tax=Cardamine amara subsp. amara TaxID=228776 RepID=A0ABD0ZF29_CARAN